MKTDSQDSSEDYMDYFSMVHNMQLVTNCIYAED
jgi:hypothetical protein